MNYAASLDQERLAGDHRDRFKRVHAVCVDHRGRDELAEVLEGWVLLGVSMHHAIIPVDGIEITVGQMA